MEVSLDPIVTYVSMNVVRVDPTKSAMKTDGQSNRIHLFEE
jgi:hypothetical protein